MPLAVADARRLVGLAANDSSRDTRLQQLIAAAYEQAADAVGPLTPTIVTETVRCRSGQLLLTRRPVTSLTTVDGVANPAVLRLYSRDGLVEGLPSGYRDGDVAVTYVWGFTTVPSSIEEGVRAWVRHRWLQESYGSDTYGGDEQAAAVTDFNGLPNAVRNAWGPYLLDTTGGFA